MTQTQNHTQPTPARREEPDYGALGAQLARETAPPLTEEQVEAAARLFVAAAADQTRAGTNPAA